jgi:hypothetical protein
MMKRAPIFYKIIGWGCLFSIVTSIFLQILEPILGMKALPKIESSNMLHANVLGYFVANDVNLKVLNQGEQALAYRQPSFSTFSTTLDLINSFSIPRQVEISSIMVGMDAVVQLLWLKNNEVQMANATDRQPVGMIASLKSWIFELLFTNEKYSSTVSQNNITVGDWTGVAYIIADPETGAEAYQISGGANGAKLVGALIGVLLGFSLIFFGTAVLPWVSAMVGIFYVIIIIELYFLIGTVHEVSGATEAKGVAAAFFLGMITGFAATREISYLGGFLLGLAFLIALYFPNFDKFIEGWED